MYRICTHCQVEPLTPQSPSNTHTHSHTLTPQTSRVLITLSVLLTVTVPLLRKVSGCVNWKQAVLTQGPLKQDTAAFRVERSAPVKALNVCKFNHSGLVLQWEGNQ